MLFVKLTGVDEHGGMPFEQFTAYEWWQLKLGNTQVATPNTYNDNIFVESRGQLNECGLIGRDVQIDEICSHNAVVTGGSLRVGIKTMRTLL